MTHRELEVLDEALLYLNEGKILDKLRDMFTAKKKKTSQTKKSSFSYYDYYKTLFKNAVESYKNDTLIENMVKSGACGVELGYLDLSLSQFDSVVKKYVKNNPNKLSPDNDDIYDWTDHNEDITNIFRSNDYILVSYDDMYFLYYFIKDRTFYLLDVVHCHRSEKCSYSKYVDDMKDIISWNEEDAIKADADLGYYRLSTPPEGVKPIKL